MDDRNTVRMIRAAACLIVASAVIAEPAHARSVTIDVPAGRAADAAISIARQTGTSIIIADRSIAVRPVPAIRGRHSAASAVKQLAKAAGAKAVKVGEAAWRLEQQEGQERRGSPRRVAASQVPVTMAAPPQKPTPEIVVIASKRDTSLDEYPGQVSIIDGKSLTLGGTGGTEKLTRRVPTLSSTHLGSGRNKLFIRGIADSSFTGPTQSTVGQYFGDLRLSYNAPDPDLRLSDLDRVEVLEGPQGTLYGAGSLGGIVRLVPNSPEMGMVTGSAMIGGSATQHGALGGDASAMINLPLMGENAAFRFSVDAETQGGYIDKPLLGRENVNRTNIFGGRAALRLEPAEGWAIDVIGIGQTTEGRDSQYADRDGLPLSRSARVGEGFNADYAQGQFVVSGEFGDIRLRSSTGITWQSLDERYDATAPDGPERLFQQQNDTTMFANETRVWQPLGDRFGWLVGASYIHNSTTLTRGLGAPDELVSTTGVENGVDEVTIYGEASVRLFDGLTANAGGRATYSWLGGEGEDVIFSNLSAADFRAMEAATADRGESKFLPAFSLVSTVVDDATLYFRYQEGFRPGGLAISGDFVSRFRNDHVSTFEFGGRYGHSGTGPLELSASVSFTRWRDIQADFIDSAGLPSTANIGNGTIWSATLTGSAEVLDGLRVDAGATYNDSEVDEPNFAFAASKLNQVPNIAGFSSRIGFEYYAPVADDLEVTAQGWAHYVGKSRLGVGPDLGELQGDYLDSGVTVRLGREDMGVSLSVTNLTDERGNRFAFGTPFAVGRDQITPLRPRTIRLGLDASF